MHGVERQGHIVFFRKIRICCRGRFSSVFSSRKPSGSISAFTSATLILWAGRIGNLRIFLAVFEQHHPALGAQSRADSSQHLLRLGKLVIDVHQQGKIDAARGQAGIVFSAEHGFIVRQFPLGHVAP